MNGRIESKICNINIEFDVSLSNDEVKINNVRKKNIKGLFL